MSDPQYNPYQPGEGQPSGQPEQPMANGYGQTPPPPPYPAAPPQYGNPPQYGTTPPQYTNAAPQYGAVPPQYAGAPVQASAIPMDEASDISTNLILSIFFGWIPALVYFLRRDRVSPITRAVYVSNMNFNLTRVLVVVVGVILMIIAGTALATSVGYDGSVSTGGATSAIFIVIIYLAMIIAGITFLVISIIAAVTAKDKAMRGIAYRFPLAIPFFK